MQPNNTPGKDNPVYPLAPQAAQQTEGNLITPTVNPEHIPMPLSTAQPPVVTGNPMNSANQSSTGLYQEKIIPRGRRRMKVAILIVGILLLGVAGYFTYNTFFAGSLKNTTLNADGHPSSADEKKIAEGEIQKPAPVINEADLTAGNEVNSSFTYPRSWTKLDSGDTFVKYQAKDSDPSGYRSTIAVDYGPAPQGKTLQGASDADLARIREGIIKQYTPTTVMQIFTEAGRQCSAEPTLKVTPDTTQNGTTIGVFYFESVCSMTDDAILKSHAVYDRDGTRRHIMILTSRSSMDKNGPVYDKILNSIKKPTSES